MTIRALGAVILVALLCAGCTDVGPAQKGAIIEARTNPFDDEAAPCCSSCQDELHAHCSSFPY